MSWKFWKREENPMDPQVLLARAQEGARPQDGPRPQDTVPGVGGAFQLTVEDVFSITGRGTVVTGLISHGAIRVGDQVLITRDGEPVVSTRVTAIEAFRRKLTEARGGDNVGLMLEGVDKGDLQPGDVVSQ